MRLSAPKKTTFWISIVFCVLGVIAEIARGNFEQYSIWCILAGAIVLILGCCVKDL